MPVPGRAGGGRRTPTGNSPPGAKPDKVIPSYRRESTGTKLLSQTIESSAIAMPVLRAAVGLQSDSNGRVGIFFVVQNRLS